jgi:phospholipid/cholesterol/gamma-HCH transport system substrate-binding protein
MAGVTIGTVTEIHLPTDPAETGIVVQLGLDPAYAGRVRQDSRAGLRILQLLTNEKFVEIVPGSLESPSLEPGARILPLEETGVFQRGEAIAENLSAITASLKTLLGSLERGEGVFSRLLIDPEFGRQGLESLAETAVHLEQLTGTLREGRGVLGRLIYDPELDGRLDDLGRAVHDLSELLAAVERGDGALGALLEEGGSAEQAVESLRSAAASFERVAARVESGETFLGQLLQESPCAEAMKRDLCTTLENLAQITGKINRGEGTLGALVNERVLHDSAEDVLAGVSDSKFARWMLRHYQKKGIEAPAPPPPPPAAADDED